jgi:dihydrofolate reductase
MDYLDADALKAATAQLSRSDAMLMGRNTYQALSTAWSTREGEFAETINAIQKYVISSTLRSTEWNNSLILSGDVITEVTELKEQDGQDLMIYGHGPLGQTLLEHGLLDEIRLSVHPIIVGTGTLFHRDARKKNELELVGSEPLPNGVIVLTYRPAAGPHPGL